MQTTHRSGGDEPAITGRMLLLNTAASLLIVVGIIGLFAPELLESLLPAQTAMELVQIAPLLLAAGLGLEGYSLYRIVQNAKAGKAQARRL